MTASGLPELHEIQPREQVGGVSGERFEFQYHQAAADALSLLDDTQVACIYCEWHDDYVIESAGVASYRFHQVKTRTASEGPWKTNEFFGTPAKRAKKTTVTTRDSIFGRLLDHVVKFGDRCELFVFVADAGISKDFAVLLEAVRPTTSQNDLTGDVATDFTNLHKALSSAFPALSQDDFHSFLKRLYVREALGKLGHLRDCRTLIGGRVHELSEVDLAISEAQKIGADLVSAVREKSHRVLLTPPASTATLRAAKGLVLDDVLRILSLSSEGYRELKAGGRDSVIALSRLHRLCKRSNVAATLVPDLCRLKTTWETWWIGQRHFVSALDVLQVKKECADALSAHSSERMDFNGLRAEAKNIAIKYEPILTTSEQLTDELVFGLMLTLAVEAVP